MFYGNSADFQTYHTSRGRSIPAEWDDSYIETALLVGSEWLDSKYDTIWYGHAVDGFEQERKWPRENAKTNTFPQYIFSNTEIPTRVVQAVYEVAFKEATSSGSLNVDFTPNKYNSVSVDGAVSVKYPENLTIQDIQTQFTRVMSLMSPLMDPAKESSNSSLSGEVSRE